MSSQPYPSTAEIDRARSREYSLLSTLLLRSPDARLLGQLATLEGDTTPIGMAHQALAEAASRLDVERVGREYFDLFVGVGRGELVPYASFYLSGSLHGAPLAALRHTLHALGIERVAGMNEPEDHAGVLCEIMAGFASGAIVAAPEEREKLFAEHIAPWMARMFSDLELAASADFYARVGALGRCFIDIEVESLLLPA
jgi:TorA maturation chaperone TorD